MRCQPHEESVHESVQDQGSSGRRESDNVQRLELRHGEDDWRDRLEFVAAQVAVSVAHTQTPDQTPARRRKRRSYTEHSQLQETRELGFERCQLVVDNIPGHSEVGGRSRYVSLPVHLTKDGELAQQ